MEQGVNDRDVCDGFILSHSVMNNETVMQLRLL